MKKKTKKLYSLLMLALVLVIFVACGGNREIDANLVGTWTASDGSSITYYEDGTGRRFRAGVLGNFEWYIQDGLLWETNFDWEFRGRIYEIVENGNAVLFGPGRVRYSRQR